MMSGQTAHRLMTVMTLPRALSPYSSSRLYTPRCSSTLTIASGVQGKIDLTVPGGAGSSAPGPDLGGLRGWGKWEAGMGRRVSGEMWRILSGRQRCGLYSWVDAKGRGRDVLVVKVEEELVVQALDVLERREH